jgi:hypothetical protein
VSKYFIENVIRKFAYWGLSCTRFVRVIHEVTVGAVDRGINMIELRGMLARGVDRKC